MSVVFEYGLVSWLMMVEHHRVRKFEAMKQMAASLQKDKEFLDAVQKQSDIGLQVDGENTASELLKKGPEQVQEVYKMFDSDQSGCMSKKEIQVGFRKLGQYLSMDQVNRMFFRLGVQEGTLQAHDFTRLLLNLAEYMPGTPFTISYWERPPSLQADLAFRYVYIVCLGCC